MDWNNVTNFCDDFDECAQNLFCGDLICNNTSPGFTCCEDEDCNTISCPDGFQLDESFEACFDVDECTELER